jgi:hypothetical protein
VCQPIECGVPQGAVLSPVLFSIFINDLPSRSNKNVNQSLLFADDLCHLEIYNQHARAEENINLLLAELDAWLSKWRLKMAPHKCTYIIFNNTNHHTPDLNILLGGERINRSSETTFLGIVLDEKLRFEQHVEKIKEACRSRINIIKILAHPSWKLDLHTLKQLYFSLVRSLFEYSSILAPVLTNTKFSEIQIVQNAALRAMLRLPRSTPIDILHNAADITLMADRLSLLASRYLVNSIINNNPLITRAYDEFIMFGINRPRARPTPLDPHLDRLETAKQIANLAR